MRKNSEQTTVSAKAVSNALQSSSAMNILQPQTGETEASTWQKHAFKVSAVPSGSRNTVLAFYCGGLSMFGAILCLLMTAYESHFIVRL